MSGMSLRQKLSVIVGSIGLVLLIFGLLLFFAGRPDSYYDFKDKSYTQQAADVGNVRLDISYGTVTVTTGTRLEVNVCNAAEELFHCSFSGNEVRIEYAPDFSERAYLKAKDIDTRINIVLPNKLLEEVTVDSGDASLSIKGITCNSFSCSSDKGSIELERVTANHSTSISSIRGDVRAEGCQFADMELDGWIGNVLFMKTTFSGCDIKGGIGELRFASCLFEGLGRIDSGFANTSLHLAGSSDDYGFSFDKGRGDITVGGNDYGQYDGTVGKKSLYIKNGSGDVAISFTQE